MLRSTSMTNVEIAEHFKVKKDTARKYTQDLYKAGLIYIHKYERTNGDFRASYRTGNRPDAERLTRKPNKYYNDRRQDRKNGIIQEVKVKPKRDIAAAWF